MTSATAKLHLKDTWSTQHVQGALSFAEKKKYFSAVKSEVESYQAKAENKYQATKHRSIMMDKNLLDTRDRVMRGVQFEKQKLKNLQEFKRQTYESILSQRQDRQPNLTSMKTTHESMLHSLKTSLDSQRLEK